MNLAARSSEAIEATKLLFLGIGFSVVWIGIVGYMVTLSRRQKALEQRLNDLKHSGTQTPNNGC